MYRHKVLICSAAAVLAAIIAGAGLSVSELHPIC